MTIYYKKSEKKLNKSKVILGLSALCLTFVLGIIYLVSMNASIASTYQLLEYKKALQEKQKINQKAQLELVRAQSLPYLSEIFKNLNMVSMGKTEYLQKFGDQVAQVTNYR